VIEVLPDVAVDFNNVVVVGLFDERPANFTIKNISDPPGW
jgi:hypothetical protein